MKQIINDNMHCLYAIFLLFSLMVSPVLEAATGSSLPGQPSFWNKPSAPPSPPPTIHPSAPLKKPVLPSMSKPYAMPGVVGLKNDKWVGADYLGYLSRSISVSVEIVKTNQVPNLVTAQMLENSIKSLLSKEEFTTDAEVKEGPPLPFLQILLFIYPAERDKFIIFGSCRLFEEVKVARKNFTPAGYWQGITWESQNIVSANKESLKREVLELVDGLAKGFVARYKLFNPENREKQSN